MTKFKKITKHNRLDAISQVTKSLDGSKTDLSEYCEFFSNVIDAIYKYGVEITFPVVVNAVGVTSNLTPFNTLDNILNALKVESPWHNMDKFVLLMSTKIFNALAGE